MNTVTTDEAQSRLNQLPDSDRREPVAASEFEAWSQRAKQTATPASEALTEQDIVKLLR